MQTFEAMDAKIGTALGRLHGLDSTLLSHAAGKARKEGLLIGEVLVRDNSVPMASVLENLGLIWGVIPLGESCSNGVSGLRAPEEPVLSCIGRDFAMKRRIAPIGVKDGRLFVAALDPSVPEIFDDISVMTGLEVMPCTATRERILQEIDRLWPASRPLADTGDDFENSQARQSEIGTAQSPSSAGKEGPGSSGTVSNDTIVFSHSANGSDHDILTGSGSPVADDLNSMLREALSWGSSDIHVEPGETATAVRYRVDGVLDKAADRPSEQHLKIISRIKLLAGMDISERRLPQDGRFRVKLGDESVDVRVSVMPSGSGERAVLRLLRKSGSFLNLGSLGMPAVILEEMERMLSRAGGIIIATGPTGSGKTTTLYGCLKKLNNPGRNIMTIEDPIEYRIPGLGQIQVKPEIGFTFSSGLRSILRQDPDVIMVGEIRDSETASIAAHASMTGHLVLTTLHTGDAASAISRLASLGVDRETIGGTLSGVVAQRLVRLVCTDCGGPDNAAGCDSCRGSGYRGRTGIFELIPVRGNVQKLITNGASPDEIRAAAAFMNGHSLFEAGLELVSRGLTTREELNRVVDPYEEGYRG